MHVIVLGCGERGAQGCICMPLTPRTTSLLPLCPSLPSFDWAQSFVQVASIAKSSGGVTITVEASTPPALPFVPKSRFMGVNILSEMDVEVRLVQTGLDWLLCLA